MLLLAYLPDYGEYCKVALVLMHSEDNELRSGDAGAQSDLEQGVFARPTRPLSSWSSYLSPSRVRFRPPAYDESPRSFSDAQLNPNISFSQPREYLSPHDGVEGQRCSQSHTLCHESPRCLPRSFNALRNSEGITPGILRPEEHPTAFGRCHHEDNRFHNMLDTLRTDKPRNGSTDTEGTLVESLVPGKGLDTHEDCSITPRLSTSSSSTYSNQASEDEKPLSTHQLIRYYTSCVGDSDDHLLTTRTHQYSIAQSIRAAEEPQDTRIPSHAFSAGYPPQESLPSLCQKSSHKPMDQLPEYFMPCARSQREVLQRSCQLNLSNGILEKNVYVLKLCKAFLLFGIQSHRLEEYLHVTAVFLGITAEFQHVPNCMLVVLTNPGSASNEVHLLKESTSVDLGKLEDVFQIHAAVVENDQDLQLSIRQLDCIVRRQKMYSNLLLILLHGMAALCAGTFAFSARPIDFGPLFALGCLLAILQLLVLRTPIGNSHILEVLTCVLIAFAARGLGSIYQRGGSSLFCFSGISQGTIALILPGHIILAAIQEIQHRHVLSGSIKMVYAILYTLFLGFGVLIGTVLFGFLDRNATSATSCELPWYWDATGERWRATYAQFVWVPVFAFAISIMHQAKRKHLPAMVFIATCGHQAFYWSLLRFAQNLQFAGMIAAFTSGLLANIYARISGCFAPPILLPAVLVHIPNALAASGSLVAGVGTANSIVANDASYVDDGLMTRGLDARDFSAKGPSGSTGLIITAVFGMAQATIGITVGLFLSALVIWPLARRKIGFLGL